MNLKEQAESNCSSNKGLNSDIAVKSGIWYVISSVMVRAVAVFTTPIFTRMMTTEEYGITATFTTWYTLLFIVFSLNLNYSIGRAKLDFPGKLDEFIGSIQLLSAFASIIISLFILLFINPFSSFMELPPKAVIILLVYLFFSPAITFAQNGFRYRYRYKENIAITWYISLTSVIISVVLFFYSQRNKAFMRMIGIASPTVILSFAFWVTSLSKGNVIINTNYWSYALKLSLPLILHTISLNILAQSDRIFIAKICSPSDVGIYSLVYSYGILISIITHAVAEGWLPWFHDNYYAQKFDAIKQNSKRIVILGVYVGFACIAFAPEAIMLLGGKQYMGGIQCVFPVVMGVLCQYVNTNYVNIELHLKKTIYVSYGTIFAAVLNIILNAIFIPIFGFVAAAYTTFVSYLCLMFVHFIITRKIIKVKLYQDSFMFCAVIITAIIGFLISLTYGYFVIRYILIFIGFISFIFIFRRKINEYIRKLKTI